jgi:hypothetical protein
VEEEEGTEEVRLLDRDFEPVDHFDVARRLASTDFTDSFSSRTQEEDVGNPSPAHSVVVVVVLVPPLYTLFPFHHHRVIPLYRQRTSFCRRRRLCLSF